MKLPASHRCCSRRTHHGSREDLRYVDERLCDRFIHHICPHRKAKDSYYSKDYGEYRRYDGDTGNGGAYPLPEALLRREGPARRYVGTCLGYVPHLYFVTSPLPVSDLEGLSVNRRCEVSEVIGQILFYVLLIPYVHLRRHLFLRIEKSTLVCG